MLYPLRFTPLLKRYLWGGRRLGTVLGKPLGAGDDYAESWEIVDHGADQSRVAFGSLAGRTLAELLAAYGPEVLGPHHPLPRFPLLLKFLDARRTLSVQVHPNDAQAALLDPPDLGKCEAWVVLAAESGSRIYSGLKAGVDRNELAARLAAGDCEACLHSFEPAVGDCVLIPPGTVHALGEGLLIAEIQQSSDTTYRLFDWNRTGADGRPRQLHIEEALAVIDFDCGPVEPVKTESPRQQASSQQASSSERLVSCDKFTLDRWQLTSPAQVNAAGNFSIITVISGEVEIDGDPADRPLGVGQTALLPASLGDAAVRPLSPAVLLVSSLA